MTEIGMTSPDVDPARMTPFLRHKSGCVCIDQDRCRAMQLQDGSRHPGRDHPADSPTNGLGLIRTACEQDDALRLHDGPHADTDRLARHVRKAREEACIRLYRIVTEIRPVRPDRKVIIRLVEADMTIPADTQDLQIDAARRLDPRIIASRLSQDISCHAVRQETADGAEIDL